MQKENENTTSLKNRVLTKEIFEEKLLKKDPYYEGRWEYFEEVICKLEKMEGINTILELGPYKSPIIKQEDVLDKYDNTSDFPYKIGTFYQHNGSVTPYPITDKKYDLVIALQVLEHFGIFGEQKAVFDELERISHKLLITLPYKWHVPNLRDHHMIDKKTIATWANNRKPTFEQVIENRILQIYEFDSIETIHKIPLKHPNNESVLIESDDEKTVNIIPRGEGSCYSYAFNPVKSGKKYKFYGNIFNNNLNNMVIRLSANNKDNILSESHEIIKCLNRMQQISLELLLPEGTETIYIQIFKLGTPVSKSNEIPIKISNFRLFEYE